MANPKLLAVDLSVPTYTWAGGVNSSYPVSNLKNYFSDSKSRSNVSTANEYITIDMGAAVSCNAVVVDGSNILTANPDIGCLLQYNTNDDTNWADAVTAATFTATNSTQLQTFNAVSKRYWRIVFSSVVGLGAAPEFGNIFLGTTLDFEKPQQYSFYTNHPMAVTSKSRALDGRLRTAQSFGPIRKHKASFKLHTDAFVTSFKTFLGTVRNDGRPFYYIDKDSNVYLVNLEKNFNPYDAQRYNQNDIVDLLMESTLADT